MKISYAFVYDQNSYMFSFFVDMPCQRETEVDGEQLKVHIQDTSDKVRTIAAYDK